MTPKGDYMIAVVIPNIYGKVLITHTEIIEYLDSFLFIKYN